MKRETTKEFLGVLIKQACEDITASIDDITCGIDDLQDLKYLNISIEFDECSHPVISINKKYKTLVSYNDEMERILFDEYQ